MAEITAALVKELRDMTGAGMMDCKKALSNTNGNKDEAVEWLRKNGLAKAEKKAGRIAAEGVSDTFVSADGKVGAIVEVNSETDFVAKNEKFRDYVSAVVAQCATTKATNIDAFLAEKWSLDSSATVKEALAAQIAVIGENMNIRRFAKLEASNGFVESYIHGNGRIAILLEVESDGNAEAAHECAKNVAMQIAAMNPQYVSKDDISAEELKKLREITIDSALNDPASLPKPILQKLIDKAVSEKAWSDEDIAIYEEKKSNMNFLFNFLSKEAPAVLAKFAFEQKDAYMADKIFSGLVEGRISKQLKEICLLDQVYVKAEDGKQNVAAYVASVAKNSGIKLSVKKFIRFETGEGLEKKNEDFAAEVAAQLG
ncbi:MAG: translation elongation factor Ts [Lachnospiraceae bacterium]|nr:translation elongation factor Ts [Lachnospiraceae bacterium]